MSKLEYLNPIDWSLHVIDGENEGVPEGWILVPESSNYLTLSPELDRTFWVDENTCWNEKSNKWMNTTTYVNAFGDNSYYNYWKNKILWSRKMKEYLVERNGKYELIEAYHLDGGVEIPDWANYAYHNDQGICFLKSELGFNHPLLLWQRSPSLNDQYTEIEKVRQADDVNNPEHYNKGGVECIDAIESSMTKEAFAGYLKGNIQKYMWRYEQKGGAESLKKAQWYLNKLVNLVEGS